jgi:hypothetical protein
MQAVRHQHVATRAVNDKSAVIQLHGAIYAALRHVLIMRSRSLTPEWMFHWVKVTGSLDTVSGSRSRLAGYRKSRSHSLARYSIK